MAVIDQKKSKSGNTYPVFDQIPAGAVQAEYSLAAPYSQPIGYVRFKKRDALLWRPEDIGGWVLHDRLLTNARRLAKRIKDEELKEQYRWINRWKTMEWEGEATGEPIDILAALWAVNRHAKRLRDRADESWKAWRRAEAKVYSDHKKICYDFKSQAIHYVMLDGLLRVIGHHRFGPNWAEVLEGSGYTFHRPCQAPSIVDAADIGGIDAKPLESGEPGIRDSLQTLDSFLRGKDEIKVYQWTRPIRYFDDFDDDDDDEY